MKLLKSVLIASLCLFCSLSAVDSAAAEDNSEATNPAYRDRMIEICSCDASKPMDRNVLGEIGEGNTFNSYFPALTLLCDASDKHLCRRFLKAGNEQVEFSQKYKFLSKVEASREAYPFLSEVISAAGRLCQEDNKRYFDIVKNLEEYGTRYFYFNGKSPNLLIVSIKLLGETPKEIFLGVFVSGGDSCKLSVDGRDTSHNALIKPLEKLNLTAHEKLIKQTNSHAQVFKALEGKLSEYGDQKEVADFQKAVLEYNRAGAVLRAKIEKDIMKHQLGAETFSHAPIFEFEGGDSVKLSLSPVSSEDLSVQASDLYRRLTKIFFGMEFDDLVRVSFYADREKISETEKLVDHRIIDVNKSTINGDRLPFKEKGCLHSGLTDCFSDSEQAFLSYLDHETPKDMTKAPTHLNKTGIATPISCITQVELRLLSTKDICKFCRATLSKSLESSILRAKLSKYLNSQGITVAEELDPKIPITVFGYSRVAISNTRS